LLSASSLLLSGILVARRAGLGRVGPVECAAIVILISLVGLS
jgi:hypothetical protein